LEIWVRFFVNRDAFGFPNGHHTIGGGSVARILTKTDP